MKSTGVVRQLDSLGRIVLPIEMRRTMEIGVKDMLEISVQDDMIVLQKYQPSCIFCGATEKLEAFRDRLICSGCLAALHDMTQPR